MVDCVSTESITHTGKAPTLDIWHTAHSEHLGKKEKLSLPVHALRCYIYIVYVITRCLLYVTPFTPWHRKGTIQGAVTVEIHFKNFDYRLSLLYKVIMAYVGKAGRIQQ